MYYILDLSIKCFPEFVLFENEPEGFEIEQDAKNWTIDRHLKKYAIIKIEDTISQVILQDGTSVTIGKK